VEERKERLLEFHGAEDHLGILSDERRVDVHSETHLNNDGFANGDRFTTDSYGRAATDALKLDVLALDVANVAKCLVELGNDAGRADHLTEGHGARGAAGYVVDVVRLAQVVNKTDLLGVGDLDVLNEQARPLQARHAGKLQLRLVDAEGANDVAGSLVEDVGRHLVVPLRLRA
jgi:hypothetical protein